jgi:hypothetical protein
VDDINKDPFDEIQVPVKARLPMFFPTSECPETNRVQQLSFITYCIMPKGEEKSAW